MNYKWLTQVMKFLCKVMKFLAKGFGSLECQYYRKNSATFIDTRLWNFCDYMHHVNYTGMKETPTIQEKV